MELKFGISFYRTEEFIMAFVNRSPKNLGKSSEREPPPFSLYYAEKEESDLRKTTANKGSTKKGLAFIHFQREENFPIATEAAKREPSNAGEGLN